MIFHLFRTDLRRTGVLFTAWLMLVGLQAGLIATTAHPGDQMMGLAYLTLSLLVPFFQLLVLIVLIPQIVQEEPLVGTTAFWFTRPIRRVTLLQSKVLFAAVLIVLPLLAELALMIVNGVTAHDLALAVPEIILAEASAITVIAVIAALTPNFGRFAAAGAIFLVVSILFGLLLGWLRIISQTETLASDFNLLKSRQVANQILILLGGGAVLLNQYLTRKTVRSIIAACVIALLSLTISGFWPWNFLVPNPPPAGLGPVNPAAIKLSLSNASSRDMLSLRLMATPLKDLDGFLELSGLPPGVFAANPKVHAHLSKADGTLIPILAPDPNFGIVGSPPDADSMEYALDGVPIVNAGARSGSSVSLFTIPADVFHQYASQPLNFSAEIDFTASRYEIVAVLPLVRGARYDHGSEHEMITDVLRQADGVNVVLSQHTLHLLFDPTAESPVAGIAIAARNEATVYLLRNRKRHQALLIKHAMRMDLTRVLTLQRRVVNQLLNLEFGSEPNFITPTLDNAWLADAELVRLQRIPLGMFTKPVALSHFRLDGLNATQRQIPPVGMSTTSFSNLKLGANPTEAEVKGYVDAILFASQRPGLRRADDPQIDLLVKVGGRHLDALFEAEDQGATGNAEYYLTMAIRALARPEDKARILKALPAHPILVDVVIKYGWKAEAHDLLLVGLRDEHQRVLPRAWIQAVASFAEPTTYPDLAAYLARCNNPAQTFNEIHLLPGIDLTSAVDAAWTRARRGPTFMILNTAGMAASFGHADALEELVNIMKESDIDEAVRRAAALFRRFTPATGNVDALLTWYAQNRDHLVFDPAVKRFMPPVSHETKNPASPNVNKLP
jgi:hypothetical protein